MLSLDRGRAMRHLTDELAHRGYTWAYRIVDSRSFGLPQRRKRVVMLASKVSDPRPVLFADEAEPGPEPDQTTVGCGFYWTEGLRGLGWAVDAVPTLKGGSTIGIPSPPAIRLPRGRGIVTPQIRDAERLQGFPSGWTLPAEEEGFKRGARWKLVGNAVSAPVAQWLGVNLVSPGGWSPDLVEPIVGAWPDAGWGSEGQGFAVAASHWPVSTAPPALLDFLEHGLVPLSERATAGFLARASRSSLRFPPGFLQDVRSHLERTRSTPQLALVS
jgi:DNA (cytosine-5)-methyltransferase 1